MPNYPVKIGYNSTTRGLIAVHHYYTNIVNTLSSLKLIFYKMFCYTVCIVLYYSKFKIARILLPYFRIIY